MSSNFLALNPAGSEPQGQQEINGTVSQPRPSISRRRDKPQLSCNICRRRKLRCDRQQPCSTCFSTGQICAYPANRTSATLPKKSNLSEPRMHDRLEQLERLVMSLMPDAATNTKVGSVSDVDGNSTIEHDEKLATTSRPNMPIDKSSGHGSLRMSASEISYVGDDHWAAILESIADLKDHFNQEGTSELVNYRPQNDHLKENDCDTRLTPRALLLYGHTQPASYSEILSALPPKTTVDRYISRYFNFQDLISSTIHGPTFLHEYEAFWLDPSSVPIIWVALLFGMISLAALASDSEESAHEQTAEKLSLQIDLYRKMIVQCLILGEYTKSGPYVLETVIYYVYIEFAIRTDADKDIWCLLGLEVNIAMRMGYHRDPHHFPGSSPLEDEMRRRVWATVLLSDILISNQMGLPRMISDWQCDTMEPRNLNDDDLDANATEMPPPRPETECTTTLSLIARRRLIMALGAISDFVTQVKSCNYDEVMRIDKNLHDAAASIPQLLKMKPMATSITDSPQVIMARLFLSHMFYKGQIMLHQRFLSLHPRSQNDESFAYSRNSCLSASICVLQLQRTLDEETRPGGQLHMMRWRISSIVNHQFLTATMILCSLLHRGQTFNRKDEIVAALQNTRMIWVQSAPTSSEAKKAAQTVNVVLERAGHTMPDVMPIDAGQAGTSRDSSTFIPSTVKGRGVGIGLDDQPMLQETADFMEPSAVFIPSFSPPGSQSLDFTFEIDDLDSGAALNEWMLTNQQGTGWW